MDEKGMSFVERGLKKMLGEFENFDIEEKLRENGMLYEPEPEPEN